MALPAVELTDLDAEILEWNYHLCEEKERAAWLDRAIFLKPDRCTRKYEVVVAVELIFDGLSLGFRRAEQKKLAVNCVLANLYLGYSLNRPLRYSKKPNNYTSVIRHNWPHYTCRIMFAVIEGFKSLELIQTANGFFKRECSAEGCQTRIWATDKLLTLFELLTPKDIASIPLKNPLILRQRLPDGRKEAVPYKDNKSTHEMRSQLERYNKFISGLDVSIRLTEAEFYGLRKNSQRCVLALARGHRLDKEMRDLLDSSHDQTSETSELWKELVDLTTHPEDTSNNYHSSNNYLTTEHHCHHAWLHDDNQTTPTTDSRYQPGPITVNVRVKGCTLHRVFNVLSTPSKRRFSKTYWRLGGRFYGSEVQNLPKELRAYVTLNGETVSEPDFSAMHLRMLYHRRGLELPPDLHDSPYDFGAGKEFNKLAVLIVINCAPQKDPIKAIRQEFRENTKLMEKYGRQILKDAFIKQLVGNFREFHSAIAEDFLTGVGLELQNLDSMIMADILTQFLDKEVPLIPVHDSVVVPQSYEDEAREVMKKAYSEHMGFNPVITE